jgi:hypothetical protein
MHRALVKISFSRRLVRRLQKRDVLMNSDIRCRPPGRCVEGPDHVAEFQATVLGSELTAEPVGVMAHHLLPKGADGQSVFGDIRSYRFEPRSGETRRTAGTIRHGFFSTNMVEQLTIAGHIM